MPPLALRPDDFIVARFGYADGPLLKIFWLFRSDSECLAEFIA